MNKVIIMGRLTKDPEVRYTQSGEPMAIARYTLAVNKRFKKQGEADADFIPCVAFGKNGEFAEKYLAKGRQVAVVGRIQVRNWEDNEGKKRTTTEVVVEEHYFAESKASSQAQRQAAPQAAGAPAKADNGVGDGFYPIDDNVEDEDLPF